jgi:rhamnose utilization protein RhaD (predicted bifunctional aldolase and dehydrogenase)
MAVPNYTYIKLKMLDSHGVITVGTSLQRAYECDLECCMLATMTIALEELAVIREVVAKDTPDSRWQARAFEPM